MPLTALYVLFWKKKKKKTGPGPCSVYTRPLKVRLGQRLKHQYVRLQTAGSPFAEERLKGLLKSKSPGLLPFPLDIIHPLVEILVEILGQRLVVLFQFFFFFIVSFFDNFTGSYDTRYSTMARLIYIMHDPWASPAAPLWKRIKSHFPWSWLSQFLKKKPFSALAMIMGGKLAAARWNAYVELCMDIHTP